MYKATVYVTLKQGVLDPQGNAVKDSLHSLNYTEVEQIRVGKYMELALEATSEDAARKRVEEMCNKLLANPVIEDFRFELHT